MRTLPFLALVVALLPAASQLAASTGGDAGLGGDASDSSAAPSLIAFGANYTGELDLGGDQDWFAVAPQAGVGCFELDASAHETGVNVTFATRGSGFDHGVRARLSVDGARPTRLLLAASDASQVYVGFAPQDAGAVERHYTFTIAPASNVTVNESLLPTPAGLLTDPMTPPGQCVSGRLDPLVGVGHTTDAFVINGSASQQVLYSLGSPSSLVRARLVDMNDANVGPSIGSNGLALATLPSDGTYYLTATATQGTDKVPYTIAIVGPQDPGSPCRPGCVLS